MSSLEGKLDELYDIIYRQLYDEDYDEIDVVFKTLDVDRYSDNILMGFLVATLSAKSKFKHRANFRERFIDKMMRKQGFDKEYAESLLKGLG